MEGRPAPARPTRPFRHHDAPPQPTDSWPQRGSSPRRSRADGGPPSHAQVTMSPSPSPWGEGPWAEQLIAVGRQAAHELVVVAKRLDPMQHLLVATGLALDEALAHARQETDAARAYSAVATSLAIACERLRPCAIPSSSTLRARYHEPLADLRELASVLGSLEQTARTVGRALEVLVSLERAARTLGPALAPTGRAQVDPRCDALPGAPSRTAGRLLELAEQVEAWAEGRSPLPPGGPPETLRRALRECALAFRRAAQHAATAAHRRQTDLA